MKDGKLTFFSGALVGLLSYWLFKLFWNYLYPRLGVEWNQYAVMAAFFFTPILIVFFYDKKCQKQRESSDNEKNVPE